MSQSNIRNLTLEQTADYLEGATIQHSYDCGFAIVHTGSSESGIRFVLVNDVTGSTTVTESPI